MMNVLPGFNVRDRARHLATAAAASLMLGVASDAFAGLTQDCPGDLNGDQSVGFADLTDLLSQWGPCPAQGPCSGDLTGDGIVGFADLTRLLNAWGPCPGVPIIDDFEPQAGPPGTLVRVRGKNFPADPDDLCMAAGNVGFRVLQATADELQAVVLPFGPDAVGGPLQIGIGQGQRALADFPAPGVGEIVEPIWCWQQAPDGPVAVAGLEFEPTNRPTGGSQTFPSELSDGDLIIDLAGVDWRRGDKIRIIARAWCDLRHIDCTLPVFRLLSDDTDGNACALAICGLITQAYNQLGVDIDCFVLPGPKILLSYPDCDIVPGISLTSLVERTPCPPGDLPPMAIDGLTPTQGREGTLVCVDVVGATAPRDTCVQFMGGCPARAIEIIGNKLILEVGPVPPNAKPARLLVARGKGTFVRPEQFFVPGVEIGAPADGFQGLAFGPDDAVAQELFTPTGGGSPDTTPFRFEPDQRVLIASLDVDWEAGDTIRVDVHFNVRDEQGVTRHYDCFADDLTIPPGANPDANQCALIICSIIKQCFAAQNPPVDVDCDVNGGTIIISTPSLGQMTSGGGTIRRIPD